LRTGPYRCYNIRYGAVAQLGERLPCTEEVRGSNPLSSTIVKPSFYEYFSPKSSQKFTKELFDKFVQSRPQGISNKTLESYDYTLKHFIGYPITAEGISLYLSRLTCKNGKLKFYSCLKALCTWLWQNNYIADNPIKRVLPPKIQKRILPALTKEQLEILYKYCHCERDKVLITLLWYSGMRISEAVSLRAGDFNWGEGTVIVLGKGNRYRKCFAGNGLIKKWFAEHDSFEIIKSGAQTMLKRLSRESNIKCNAHSFRRGFCVHQVKSGLSTRVVQALGGWESITMVERYSRSFDFDGALELYRKVNGF